MPPKEQVGVLLLLKQMIERYPGLKSSFLEVDEDSADYGFGDFHIFYRPDVNDPSIANAGQTHSLFEIIRTVSVSQGLTLKLAKSIL